LEEGPMLSNKLGTTGTPMADDEMKQWLEEAKKA
jgi:hypothetical protein